MVDLGFGQPREGVAKDKTSSQHEQRSFCQYDGNLEARCGGCDHISQFHGCYMENEHCHF